MKEKNEVSSRYLTSAFLKRSTAADLLTSFLAALNCLDLKNLIQVSMDGPNVNKKFLTDLRNYLKNDLQYETTLIDWVAVAFIHYTVLIKLILM